MLDILPWYFLCEYYRGIGFVVVVAEVLMYVCACRAANTTWVLYAMWGPSSQKRIFRIRLEPCCEQLCACESKCRARCGPRVPQGHDAAAAAGCLQTR